MESWAKVTMDTHLHTGWRKTAGAWIVGVSVWLTALGGMVVVDLQRPAGPHHPGVDVIAANEAGPKVAALAIPLHGLETHL